MRKELRTLDGSASSGLKGRQLQLRYNAWHSRLGRSTVDAGPDPRQLPMFDWLLAMVGCQAGYSLLDVACGQGEFLAYAASRGLRVSGIDISDFAVDEARRRLPDADIRIGEGESLPFDDQSFDLVSCIGSLEHFPDPVSGAAEMRRVLRKDGSALIFVPNLFFLGHIWFGLRHGTQPTEAGQDFSETFLSSQGWGNLLSEAGFVVRDFHPWNQIYASERVSPAVKLVWNAVSRLVPRNGAYAFAFVCSRGLNDL
jgi:SAM-dependent methyltransferase